MASQLPKITHVLELCLYARHLPTTVSFYRDTLRLGTPVLDTPRMAVFPLGSTTLLLFQRGETTADSPLPNDKGIIPGHGLPRSAETDRVELKTHFALAVEKREDVDAWETELRGKGVDVLSRVEWPKGGTSLYFRDPDGAVGELASRGIWPHF
ncbi:hypothetical protein JCM10207_007694 [Rhodosporidiobolus poonsookiae]